MTLMIQALGRARLRRAHFISADAAHEEKARARRSLSLPQICKNAAPANS